MNIWQDQMKVHKYIWEKYNGDLVILTLFCYSGRKISIINMKENVCKDVLCQKSKIRIVTCKTWMKLKLSLFYKELNS